MKQLNRPRQGRILGGICAGIAAHFEVDPIVIRLIWVALTLLSLGTGIIVYLVAWVLIPEGTENPDPSPAP